MPRRSFKLNNIVPVIIISSLVVISDYITKMMIVEKIMRYEQVNIFPFLNIVYVENKGAAFGIFAGLGNPLFITVACIAIIFIIFYISRLPRGMEFYSLSMVLGGAIGNLIDRIRIGKVIDFIDIYYAEWHWPAFNIADSALTVGITLFIIANFKSSKNIQNS